MTHLKKVIIDNVDIVDEISKYIEVSPSGGNYVCICPFHDDTSPSLTISREKKIFKCFACNAGGNVIDFITRFEKISYEDAVKKLNTEHNLKLTINERKEAIIALTPLHKIINDTSSYYNSLLNLMQNDQVIAEFIADRKLNKQTIEKFNLGISLGEGENLKEYLQAKILTDNAYDASLIVESRILNEKNFEFFHKRFIIPIKDENGVTVGFSGRVLKEGKPKYLNSPDSQIFKKNNILYNYFEVKKARPKELIITEGFFDVFSLYQIDEVNVLATMGTAVTSQHLKQLRQLRLEKIYLGFDNDSAGEKTTVEVGRKLLAEKFAKIVVLDLKDVKDIDEYIKKYELSSSKVLKSRSISFKEFEINYLLKENRLETVDQKISFIKTIVKNMDQLENLEQEILLERLSTLSEIDVNIIKKTYMQKEKQLIKKAQIKNNKVESKITFASNEMMLLKMIYNNPEEFQRVYQQFKINGYHYKDYEQTFADLNQYYEVNEKFNYIIFTDQFPESGHVIETINKKLIINNDSIDTIIERYLNENKKIWNLFKK